MKREGSAARIVLIVGFLIAAAAGAYLAYAWYAKNGRGQHPATSGEASPPAATGTAAPQAPAARQMPTAEAGAELCHATLKQAQGLGIVPGFAELISEQPEATKKAGRYVCTASTDSSLFSLGTELICADLKNPKCVSLYAVVQNGKTVLYKRD